MDRLEFIRDLLARLDPTQPIWQWPPHAWYVERPDGTGYALGRSLQVDPISSHLIVGPIGCGKSTALLAAGRVLLGTPGVFLHYVEVSRVLELGAADDVALAIAVAYDLAKLLAERSPGDEHVAALHRHLARLIEGGLDPYRDVDPDGHPDWVDPVVTAPRRGMSQGLLEHIDTFALLRAIVKNQTGGARLVLLLDGLDRLSDPIVFDQLVEPFLNLLKEVGIGVAMVGPRRAISGLDRLGAAAVFDELHWVGPVDPSPGAPGQKFLLDVLNARDVAGVVPPAMQVELVRWSGGVIRMLLQLAREAIKEMWVRNAETVGPIEVQQAANKVGRSLMLGLADSEFVLLTKLLKTGVFASRTPEQAALPLTNRVLEYRQENGRVRQEVHPTLVRFLTALGDDQPANEAR